MHGALCVCWTGQDWVELAEIVSLVYIFLFYPGFNIIPLVLDLTFRPNYYSWPLLVPLYLWISVWLFCLFNFTGHIGPHHWAQSFPGGSDCKGCLQCWRLGFSPWLGRSLEKEMATHSSILPWRIPWTGVWQAMVHGVTKSLTWLND